MFKGYLWAQFEATKIPLRAGANISSASLKIFWNFASSFAGLMLFIWRIVYNFWLVQDIIILLLIGYTYITTASMQCLALPVGSLHICLLLRLSGFKDGHYGWLGQKISFPSALFCVFIFFKIGVQSDLKKITLFDDLPKAPLGLIRILILQVSALANNAKELRL